MATTFANGINPWTQVKQPTEKQPMKKKTPTTTGNRIDATELEIASDPLPTVRLVTNKYWPTFVKLKVGQNIRCKPADVQAIAQALRKYIDVHKVTAKGKPTRVLTQSNAPDGIGRVWLVEGEPKSKLKAAA